MSAIKRKLLYGGAVFVLILSIIAFVFIPALGGSASAKPIVFGKWDGTPIEYVENSYFIRQMQNISSEMEAKGQEITDFDYYQIMQTAFRSAAVRLAILDEITSAGYVVPKSKLNKALIPYYQDENGKYSSKIYAETPDATRSLLRSVTTEELTAQRYINDYFGDQNKFFGFKTSSKEVEALKKMSQTERVFQYVSFSTSVYPEDKVIEWGKANSELFSKLSLSIITVDSEPTAKKIVSELSKNSITFEEAVTTYSTLALSSPEGKLNATYRNTVNTVFTDSKVLETVLALNPGETSSVLKLESSFAIVRCDEPQTEPDFADETVITLVRSHMNDNERGIIEDYFMEQGAAFTELAKSTSFDAAAKQLGVTKKTTTSFGINYGNNPLLTPVPVEQNAELASVVSNETFFKTAFSLALLEVSPPILLGTEVVVVTPTEEKASDSQMNEMASLLYDYYSTNWAQEDFSTDILKHKKLQDNFLATYLENFMN